MTQRRKRRTFDLSTLATVDDWKVKFDAANSSQNTYYAPLWNSVDCLNLYNGAYAIDGLANAYLATGSTTYLDYAKTYIDSRIATAVAANTIVGTNYSADSYLTWYKDGTGVGRTDKYQYPLDESYAWRYVCKLLSAMKEVGTHLSVEPYATFYTDTLAFTETNIWDKWHSRAATAGWGNIFYRSNSNMCSHWGMVSLFLKDLTASATRRQQCIDVFRDIAHEGMMVWPINGYAFRDLLYSYTDATTSKPYYLFGFGWTPSPTDIISCDYANNVIAWLYECWRKGEFISYKDFTKIAYDIELLAWSTSAPYPDKIDGTGTDTGWYSDGIVKTGSINPQIQAWAYTHEIGKGWQLYGAGMMNAKNLGVRQSLWTPESLSLEMWFDADDSSTITQSGGFVSQWGDKSGNSRHLSQGTGGQQPAVSSGALNGRDVINFDGSNDYIYNTTVGAGGQTSAVMIAVFKYNSGNIPMSTGVTGGEIRAMFRNNSYSSMGFATWANDFNFSPIDWDIAGDYHVFAAWNPQLATPGNVVLGRDGTYITGSTPSDMTAMDDGFTIGSLQGVNVSWYYTNISVAEILVAYTPFSEANLRKIEGYLAHKWGLESKLPASHPYKILPPPA